MLGTSEIRPSDEKNRRNSIILIERSLREAKRDTFTDRNIQQL